MPVYKTSSSFVTCLAKEVNEGNNFVQMVMSHEETKEICIAGSNAIVIDKRTGISYEARQVLVFCHDAPGPQSQQYPPIRQS